MVDHLLEGSRMGWWESICWEGDVPIAEPRVLEVRVGGYGGLEVGGR